MTGIAILDQKHSFQTTMSLPETLQLLDIVRSIFFIYNHRFHLAGMHDQEHQDVDSPAVRYHAL